MTLDLDDLIDAMMNSQQGVDYYLNTKTGEIIMRSEYLPISELNDIENELDENWDFILEIPDQREVEDYPSIVNSSGICLMVKPRMR